MKLLPGLPLFLLQTFIRVEKHPENSLSPWRRARLRELTSGRAEGSRPSGVSSNSMSNPSECRRGAPACRPGDARGRGSEGFSGVGGVGGQYADDAAAAASAAATDDDDDGRSGGDGGR